MVDQQRFRRDSDGAELADEWATQVEPFQIGPQAAFTPSLHMGTPSSSLSERR